jgi:alpha-beta hydrolase superfamily lysophospholipase
MTTTSESDALAAYFRESAVLTRLGQREPQPVVQDLWLRHGDIRVHLDLYQAATATATVVFQPGAGSYARFYAPLCQALARSGFNVLGIDRPGHGYSEGARGDCTVADAIAVTGLAIDTARQRFGLPVVLLGSSLGGLITGFSVLAGLRPDLAIAHNFGLPGRLFSQRLRARWIERFRKRPYEIAKLAKGFKGISKDPAMLAYLSARADPQAAWTQTPRAVASLLRHNPPRPKGPAAPLVLISGTRDSIIPFWSSRWFLRWSGLRNVSYVTLRDAGHMVFHDHLEQALAVLVPLMTPLTSAGGKSTMAVAAAS